MEQRKVSLPSGVSGSNGELSGTAVYFESTDFLFSPRYWTIIPFLNYATSLLPITAHDLVFSRSTACRWYILYHLSLCLSFYTPLFLACHGYFKRWTRLIRLAH